MTNTKRKRRRRGPIKWIKNKISLWLISRKMEKAKKAGIVDEYGLTGKTGIIPGLGIANMNYSATPGKVFVRDRGQDYGWFRCKEEEAIQNNYHIIRCNYCQKPAVTLDHSYPYQMEYTACAEHKNEYDKRIGRV